MVGLFSTSMSVVKGRLSHPWEPTILIFDKVGILRVSVRAQFGQISQGNQSFVNDYLN